MARPPVGPATILVVDDDAAMRMIVSLTLKLFGYTVLLAEDGETALRLARDHPEIRVVVLDVVMSGLAGKELAGHLKSSLPEAAILFCSGHPASALGRYGVDVEAGNFVQKPCQAEELRRKIEELLASRPASAT